MSKRSNKVSQLRAQYDDRGRSSTVMVRPTMALTAPNQDQHNQENEQPNDMPALRVAFSVQDRIKYLVHNAQSPRDARRELPHYQVYTMTPRLELGADRLHELESLRKQLEDKTIQYETLKQEIRHQNEKDDKIQTLEQKLTEVMQELHNEKENRKTISEKLDSDMKAIVDERDQLRSTVERLEAENKDLQNRDKMDVCNENQPNYQEIAEMAERLRVLLKTFEEGSQQLVGALEEVVDLA